MYSQIFVIVDCVHIDPRDLNRDHGRFDPLQDHHQFPGLCHIELQVVQLTRCDAVIDQSLVLWWCYNRHLTAFRVLLLWFLLLEVILTFISIQHFFSAHLTPKSNAMKIHELYKVLPQGQGLQS